MSTRVLRLNPPFQKFGMEPYCSMGKLVCENALEMSRPSEKGIESIEQAHPGRRMPGTVIDPDLARGLPIGPVGDHLTMPWLPLVSNEPDRTIEVGGENVLLESLIEQLHFLRRPRNTLLRKLDSVTYDHIHIGPPLLDGCDPRLGVVGIKTRLPWGWYIWCWRRCDRLA